MGSPGEGTNTPPDEHGSRGTLLRVQAESSQSGTPHARITAALGYAGLGREDAAKALGVSVETVSRLRNGQHPDPESFYRAVAKATGAPMWFLEHGFDGYRVADEAEPTARERLDALEGEVEALRNQHRELRETRERLDAVESDVSAVLDLAAKWPIAEPPGVRAPAPPASRRADSTPRRSERRQGEGSEPGTER